MSKTAILQQPSAPLLPYRSLMPSSVGRMGKMRGGAGVKPTQKFRLLVLALCAPYFLALLYRLVGHPHPAKWFTPLCLFYSLGAIISTYVYLLRHPELRSSQEEKARRLAAINPQKATAQVLVFLAVSLLAFSLFLFFDRDPPSDLVFAQGVVHARGLGIYRGAGWGGVFLTLLALLRLCQVFVRKRKAKFN
jgi:hypothetical protein